LGVNLTVRVLVNPITSDAGVKVTELIDPVDAVKKMPEFCWSRILLLAS